ncbi:MAG: SPOR domain-containing protein [Pseudomonadota bacterium]
MRNLFFMLALANVLFFGWQYAVRDRTEPGVEVVPQSSLKDNVALVQTADETASAEEDIATLDTEPAPPPKALAAAVGPRCLTVGPFTKVGEANAAMATLQDNGTTVSQRATQGTELVGHWVYVDNIPTRQAARALVDKLRAGGIKDASLYAGKRGEDLISLGIFRSLSGAERIELQAESMGIEANMTKKNRDTTVFYLDVRLSEGEDSGDFADSYGEERVFLGAAATCPGNA